MAGASLLTLIDDIASLLDDIAAMTKVAAKKTASVLGDDLALNAQQVTGVNAERELPVVWAVAKGSLINKAILVPVALLISAFTPWAVIPLLMVGGAFLCFEGFEKLAHRYLHTAQEDTQNHTQHIQANASNIDLLIFEKEKIKGAIRTDFILSAEIIVISLGTVAGAAFGHQVAVLIAIALLMTVGVYGLVAAIVKLDDLGMWMARRPGASSQALGKWMVSAAPWLMKTLSLVGTAAMFLVGGSILVHGVPGIAHFIDQIAATTAASLPIAGLWQWLITATAHALVGIVVGAMVLGLVMLVKRYFLASQPPRTKTPSTPK